MCIAHRRVGEEESILGQWQQNVVTNKFSLNRSWGDQVKQIPTDKLPPMLTEQCSALCWTSCSYIFRWQHFVSFPKLQSLYSFRRLKWTPRHACWRSSTPPAQSSLPRCATSTSRTGKALSSSTASPTIRPFKISRPCGIRLSAWKDASGFRSCLSATRWTWNPNGRCQRWRGWLSLRYGDAPLWRRLPGIESMWMRSLPRLWGRWTWNLSQRTEKSSALVAASPSDPDLQFWWRSCWSISIRFCDPQIFAVTSKNISIKPFKVKPGPHFARGGMVMAELNEGSPFFKDNLMGKWKLHFSLSCVGSRRAPICAVVKSALKYIQAWVHLLPCFLKRAQKE